MYTYICTHTHANKHTNDLTHKLGSFDGYAVLAIHPTESTVQGGEDV